MTNTRRLAWTDRLAVALPGQLGILSAIALIYPIAMCAIFFPTPATDLREHINWGFNFPFYTWKHPPLQSWAAALVALTGAQDSWFYVLAGQILNLAGLYYLVRAAREFLGVGAAQTVLILIAGSIYFVASLVTTVLNADQILFPLWAGVLFHAMAALQNDRWRDWLALGILAGLSLLGKYYSVLLIAALFIAILWHSEFRRSFRNYRFYMAGFICFAIAATNAVPMVLHPELLRYQMTLVQAGGSITERLFSLLLFAVSLPLYGLPAVAVLAVLGHRRSGVELHWPREGIPRFIVTAAIALLLLTAMVIVVTGLHYNVRYSRPLFAIFILVLVSVVRIDASAREICTRVAITAWICVLVGSVVYALTFINRPLREPVSAAAAALRERWTQQFKCGPAYIIGEKRPAHGVAVYYGGVIGVSHNDFDYAQWVDRERLQRLGAIVIATPERPDSMAFTGEFANRTATETMTLPFRHTFSDRREVYNFYFVPPRDCSR